MPAVRVRLSRTGCRKPQSIVMYPSPSDFTKKTSGISREGNVLHVPPLPRPAWGGVSPSSGAAGPDSPGALGNSEMRSAMPLGIEARSHACQRRFGRQRQSGGPLPPHPSHLPKGEGATLAALRTYGRLPRRNNSQAKIPGTPSCRRLSGGVGLGA